MSSSTALGFLTHSKAPFRSSIAASTFPSHNWPSSPFSSSRRRSLGPPADTHLFIAPFPKMPPAHDHCLEGNPQALEPCSNPCRPSPKSSNRRSPRRTPNCNSRADTCNHRPSGVASANAYRKPATSTTAVNVHTSLRPVDGWALVLTSSGSTITKPSSTTRGSSVGHRAGWLTSRKARRDPLGLGLFPLSLGFLGVVPRRVIID